MAKPNGERDQQNDTIIHIIATENRHPYIPYQNWMLKSIHIHIYHIPYQYLVGVVSTATTTTSTMKTMALIEMWIKSCTFYSKCLLVGGFRVINSFDDIVPQPINTFSTKHGSFERESQFKIENNPKMGN